MMSAVDLLEIDLSTFISPSFMRLLTSFFVRPKSILGL